MGSNKQEVNNSPIYANILEISRKTGVPVKKIQDMLHVLSSGESVDNSELTRRLGVSRNALSQVKLHLSNYLKPPSGRTQLGIEKVEDVKKMFLNREYFSEEALFKLLENEQYRENVDFLRGIQKFRPSPNRGYDQFTATTETTAKRASLLKFFGDIDGKKILLLGDDDFTSVAIARYMTAENITVLDIDERVLVGIEQISIQQNFGIKTVKHDLRKGLLKDIVGQYDLVFTDPPYTSEGIGLFTSRAVDALDRENQSARLYLCYGNSDRAKERFLPVYSSIVDSGFMMRWIFDKFNRYEEAESIGSASSLLVCDVTPKTKALMKGSFNGKIYTDN